MSKISNWEWAKPSAQSPFRKLIFDSSSQEVHLNTDIKLFWSCTILLNFFFPNTLWAIKINTIKN